MVDDSRLKEALRPIRKMLSALRWAAVALVLTVTLFVPFSTYHGATQRNAILVCVLAMSVFATAQQMGLGMRWFARVPLAVSAIDSVIILALIYSSDGVHSPFYPLFYLVVIGAGVASGTLSGMLAAGVISLMSVGIELIHSGAVGACTPLLMGDLLGTIPYLFLTALISGALGERVRVVANEESRLRTQREANEREMEVARRVQRAQLPPQVPKMELADIAVVYKPARRVGGDLYDFYPVTCAGFGLAVADVAGKGVPAALMVSTAKYAVREHSSPDLVAMMRGVNSNLVSATMEDSFVTMLCGYLSLNEREFRYVNAGQMPPIVVKADGSETVCYDHSDPPLGVIAEAEYTQQRITLAPGDTLILYTDGVTDALQSTDDGIAEFRALLATLNPRDLTTWREELLGSLVSPRHLDDVTVVAIRVR